MKEIQEVLKKSFGYDQFRSDQEEIIETILAGNDCLVLMPTGGGKSLCFQIPALVFEGITIVVSPLISLMKDQVESLLSNGIEARYFNSSLSPYEEDEVIGLAKSGQLKLLYLSPEKLVASMNTWLTELNISLVAIDEAHCVSMWGHDFRPEYTMMKTFRNQLPDVPFVALTATADKTTRKDVIKQIGLVGAKTFVSSFNRSNLSLNVRANIPKKAKIKEIHAFISKREHQSGIIYCLSRKGTEEMATDLRNLGINAKAYHAGIPSEKRSKIQEEFITDETPIICATIAFGMGIDKSNVQWVIHSNLPKNLEGYYQEIGRAGRDGLPSDTVLYFNLRDLMVLKRFTVGNAKSDVYLDKLQRMLHYAEATSCRRRILLSYFSEHLEDNCGNCDVCNNPPKFIDGTIIAQKALSGVFRTNQKIGTIMLINILRGSGNQDIVRSGYDRIKTFGVGADLSYKAWQHYLTQMINLGLFEISYEESFSLKITPFGDRVLYDGLKVDLTLPVIKVEKEKKSKKTKTKVSPDEQLFELLRNTRAILARENNVPAYIIFHDATLKELAAEKPVSELDLLAIQGISEVKLEKYGKEILETIKEFKTTKKNTFDVTFDMYKLGLPLEEIAEKRSLKIETIISHLSKLYLDGKEVDLSMFVDSKEVDRIRECHKSINDTKVLKPYFDKCEGEIAYYKIRVALTIIEKELVEAL